MKPLRCISALAHALCDPPGKNFSSHCKASHSTCLLRNNSSLPSAVGFSASIFKRCATASRQSAPSGLSAHLTSHRGGARSPARPTRGVDHLQQLQHSGRCDVLVQHLAEDTRDPLVDGNPGEPRELVQLTQRLGRQRLLLGHRTADSC